MSEPHEPLANIMDQTLAQLQAQLETWHEARFRAVQIWRWLYVQWVESFDQMTSLPLHLREQLEQTYRLSPLTPVDEQVSRDRLTRKVLFSLPDGETIETVLMEYEQRRSVCVSSQVGCPVGCSFCATGQSGFKRDLSPGEIIAQPIYLARSLRDAGQVLTNIVLMGMGEPLLNYDAVWQAVETWNDPDGFNMGARRITISTAGYVPGINRLAEASLQVGLAVSWHAPDDALRDQLVPLNRRYPISELLVACHNYVRRTGRRLTIEYALIEGMNDSVDQANRLADLLQGLLCHVNLIQVNPTPDSPCQPSPLPKVRAFQKTLLARQVPTTLRVRRGIDIQAGCGQLRQRQRTSQSENA